MHDLTIKNARIFDGSGGPAIHGAVGVADGRIVEIGDDVGAARETIDAGGLALMPGIIDTHTHFDAQLTWDPWADPSPALGVTTVVIGNCGFTIAPCKSQHQDLIMRNLTHVEGMSLDALRAGTRWDFETFPEYLNMLSASGVGPNVAVYVGHSAVRTYVMGEDANKRAATDEELAAMCAIVREAMDQGAIGFSTSTFEGHNGENGVPMPSRLAEQAEIDALVHAMAQSGRGVFMLTRGSGTKIKHLEHLASESGRPVLIAAFLVNPQNPDPMFTALDRISEARSRDAELYAQVSCCPLTMEFTLKNPYLMESLDSWRPAMEATGDDLIRIYRDPEFRAGVRHEIANPKRMVVFNGDWTKIQVIETVNETNRKKEGRSVAELASEASVDPLDWLLDFGMTEDLSTVFASQLLNNDDEIVGRMLKDPNASIALSDAGAHLTFFCDAGYGLHMLGHWVRGNQVMSLEKAVYALTGRQADIYRVKDRGRLVEGAWADMMLFDPETVGRTSNRRVKDLPAGAARLTTGAIGVEGVWVNGARVADSNGLTNSQKPPGQILRDFAA